MIEVKGISVLRVPGAILTGYVVHLKIRNLSTSRNVEYNKWLRDNLDSYDKWQVPAGKIERVLLFCEML